MDVADLDYELPSGVDRAAAGRAARRVAAARLRPGDREVRHRRFADLPERARPASSSSSTTRASCRRDSRCGGRAAVPRRCCCSSGSARRRSGKAWRGRRGGCGPVSALGPVELSRSSARAAGALRLEGEPAGEAPLPPYITEPLADPERYQTVYARRGRLGGRAHRRAALHAGAARARLDVERVTLHVGLDTFRPWRSRRSTTHGCTASATASSPAAWARIARRAGRRARRRHDDGPRARDARARRRRTPAAPRSSSRRASSSAASARC